MAKIGRGGKFISNEIRKNFSSFYVFGDLSTTKKDLIGPNDLTYAGGSSGPSLFYGHENVGESCDAGKTLLNEAIIPSITGFPICMFVHCQANSASLDGQYAMALGPIGANYLNKYAIGEVVAFQRAIGDMLDGGAYSWTDESKLVPDRDYACGLIIRSLTDFTMFVNGEKLTADLTTASGFTTKDAVYVGSNNTEAYSWSGGIFSAGWGTIDPGDDFLKRLSANPNQVIFQQMFQPRKSTVTASSVKFRRSFTGIRSGSRQPIP
jgi:hypothetical protein